MLKNEKKDHSNLPVKVEETPDYTVFEMKKTGKLVLPENVLAQITFLHASIGQTEWSGILFYDVIEGNPSKPETFKLEAKYIYLMDIGSAAYTEYEPGVEFIDVYDKFEDAVSWKTGQVHTHHNMNAYFSGTDMSELKTNVDKYNYYLSLIVNFDGSYVAKVAFLSDVRVESTMDFVNDDGKKKLFKNKESEKRMVTIDMDILYTVDDFTSDRIEEIRKEQEKKEKEEEKRKFHFPKSGFKQASYDKWYAEKARQAEEDFFDDRRLSPINPTNADPKHLSNLELEKLTRNILGVNTELREIRGIYTILVTISESNEDLEIYFNYLETNLEAIIENFFDGPLGDDELLIVMDEVTKSINRFAGNVKLKSLVAGISNSIFDFVQMKEDMREEDDDEEMRILENSFNRT